MLSLSLLSCTASDEHLSVSEDAGIRPDAHLAPQVDASVAANVDGSSLSGDVCDLCLGVRYVPCTPEGAADEPVNCASGACAPGYGCLLCATGAPICLGNEVRRCDLEGKSLDELVETCDVDAGQVCHLGACADACAVAAEDPSNIGCEFWAVDLDQQDYFNDPASAPWGVALSNTGAGRTHVTIALNDAPVGETPAPRMVVELDVEPGELATAVLPTRELDCGVAPNDYASPGTCLSSNAFRITSSAPIVAYQFNAFANTYSNDASLLLPTSALGRRYRVLGWPAENPGYPVVPGLNIVDRAYVTVIGTAPDTQVRVRPSFRIKGNAPVAATLPGGEISVTIGAFDVLNLETDDATADDDPSTRADLSATAVEASKPVAVFSGVELATAPANVLDVPRPPGLPSNVSSCCADHLEDQMFPVESVGSQYVVTRSALRSTSTLREPDILRFVGVAEDAQVETSLPPPFDTFTLAPGEVRTTWTRDNVVVSATKPVMVGQVLVSGNYVDGDPIGDPSLTIYPPVTQFRTDYLISTPATWPRNWVVIAAEVGAAVALDGVSTDTCATEPAGSLAGTEYESRACPLDEGTHRLSSETPFGIIAYGYGLAGSYAFAGGANVKRMYEPPPLL